MNLLNEEDNPNINFREDLVMTDLDNLALCPLGRKFPEIMKKLIRILEEDKVFKSVLMRPLLGILAATKLNGIYFLIDSNHWIRVKSNGIVEGPILEKELKREVAKYVDRHLGKYASNTPSICDFRLDRNANNLVLLLQNKREAVLLESEKLLFKNGYWSPKTKEFL